MRAAKDLFCPKPSKRKFSLRVNAVEGLSQNVLEKDGFVGAAETRRNRRQQKNLNILGLMNKNAQLQRHEISG